MDNIKITSVSIGGYKTVQLIGRETFYETFATYNTEDNMEKNLSENYTDQKVQEGIIF